MTPHQQGERVLRFTLTLGPVAGDSGATVTFTQLRLGGAHDMRTLQGPWTYALTPAMLRDGLAASTIAVGATVQADGVRVTVDRLERRSDGVWVSYAVTSQRDQPVQFAQSLARMILSDGSVWTSTADSSPEQDDPRIAPGQTVNYIAQFPATVASASSGQLQFGPFLTSNGAPASIVVHNPFGAWSADPLTIGGDRLTVSQVIQDDAGLTIVVENREPTAASSTMLLGVDGESEITATDNLGHTYHPSSASTGMRKQADGSLGAGQTTFTFEGVDSAASELTVSVPSSETLLRGPWSVSVPLQ